MTDASMLALPDFNLPFLLQTDASGLGMGAVFSQGMKPITFFNKLYAPKMLASSTYLRELHAITTAVKKWHQYLMGHFFIIQTDHKPLKELMSQAIQTPEQQVYLVKLLGFNYEIQHKPGHLNVVVDALSRVHEDSVQCLVISIPQPVLLQKLRDKLPLHSRFLELKEKIKATPTSLPDFSISQDLILYKGKIWLPPQCEFIQLLLMEFYESPIGGHMGVKRTLARLQQIFFWDSMASDVATLVKQCLICHQIKYVPKKPGGLLQPIPPPHRIWEDLSMDFVCGLPPSDGYTVIFVVVDRFSKGAHFRALPSSYTAYQVARLFVTLVAKLHGMPKSIISDRDPIFLSKFWQALFKACGTKLRMSTAYHPKSDGQTEVVNRTLQQYLMAFVHTKP